MSSDFSITGVDKHTARLVKGRSDCKATVLFKCWRNVFFNNTTTMPLAKAEPQKDSLSDDEIMFSPKPREVLPGFHPECTKSLPMFSKV